MTSPLKAWVDNGNFGGGGGGGMSLGRDGRIPFDNDWTNFFGAGIVDTFLTPKFGDGSAGFKYSEPCNE